MNKSTVIDASVVAKWLLPDEEDLTADAVKEDFAKRIIAISVPAFIFYEINNLLKSAVLSGRINAKDATRLYGNFLDFEFSVYWSRQLLKAALEKALEFNISSYDASYVALAEYLQVPFYTADAKLVKKVSGKLVRLLENYN